jgi:hypothetical protein
VSEYLLTGITIAIAASLAAGGYAGAVQGLRGPHSGPTLRTQLVCQNVWVIAVLGGEAWQAWLAYWDATTKDFVLVCVLFVLTVPSVGWVYSRAEAASAAAFAGEAMKDEG